MLHRLTVYSHCLLLVITVNILETEVGNVILYTILVKNDMLLMQEHCIYKSELNKMCKLGDGKSSMDECIAREGPVEIIT